ncbi:MAG: SDR family oxidoreductase [Taibaiella sp.]|nr:SDR family oxidoreductase [Taibaiella sp.]
MEHKKTALITGVRNERSIAFAIAQKLHEQGYNLAISYTADTKDDVLYQLQKNGMQNVVAGEVDIRNEQQIQNFCREATNHFGAIDCVLHAVAYGSAKVLCTKAPFSDEEATGYIDIPLNELEEAIDIGAYSLLRLTRAVLPHLGSNASILTTTYNASQRVLPAYAGMGMVKACLENCMKYLAWSLGEQGHRVNALSPGLLMTTSAAGIKGVRTMRKQSAEASPLGNISLKDVAEAAAYYFSDASQKVTGNIHYIDGGLNIMGSA